MTHHSPRIFMIAAAFGLSAAAAQAQDLVVDGSLCVGFDCPANPSFGFDTIRLQENNLRIHFDDTSSTASFPNQDWRIEVNASANGGSEHFRVIDATASRNIFTLEANAPSNSLVVDNGGRIGNGTANPVVELHSANGDTPTLRLEQTGAAGFAPQSWDVAGNETNFFIRDVSNGSTLPFRVRPGAPTSAVDVNGDGDVGLGDASPSADLDITRTGTQVLVEFEATGGTASVWNLVMDNDGTPNEGISFTRAGTGSREMRIQPNGDMTITGTLTTGGVTCGGGCDAVFTEEYDLPSIAEHTKAMYDLGYLPNVGPTIENQPINVSDKLGRMLNELEHAHIYIAELHTEITDLKGTHAAQIQALTERLNTLEAQE